jgi:hypothetical protein
METPTFSRNMSKSMYMCIRVGPEIRPLHRDLQCSIVLGRRVSQARNQQKTLGSTRLLLGLFFDLEDGNDVTTKRQAFSELHNVTT